MKYQIDQSGKIEQTERLTVLAICNDVLTTVQISAKIKRQLQEGFRRCGMSRLYVYYLFSTGVYFLLKNLKETIEVTIDKEYPGKEKLIKGLIEELLLKNQKPIHNIRFERIGNQPKVHYAAYDVFTKKKRPQHTLTLDEVIEVIKKTDGRLRECLSTLVGARPRSIKRIYHTERTKSKSNKKPGAL